MFTKKTTEPTALQVAIDGLFAELATHQGGSDEYAKIVDQLSALYKLKEIDTPKGVSMETWATIAGNLAGIVLIIGHERANVIGSKALSFVMKLR